MQLKIAHSVSLHDILIPKTLSLNIQLHEAQLSQRDRATAAWVSFGPKCRKRTFCGHYRSLQSLWRIGLQSYRIRWNNALQGHL